MRPDQPLPDRLEQTPLFFRQFSKAKCPARVNQRVFADQVFYVAGGAPNAIAPFMLKSEADAFATKTGGKVMTFEQALKATVSGG